MIDQIRHNLVETAAALGALLGLYAFCKRFRTIIQAWYDRRLAWRRLPATVAGIADNVGFIMADREQEKKHANYPYFECDQNGNNLLTSAAYRTLVGITSEEDLDGLDWLNVIHPDDRQEYADYFEKISKSKARFIRAARFQNPLTGAQKGKWKVVAPPVIYGNKILYGGRLSPIDMYAKEIALRHGWDCGEAPSKEQTTDAFVGIHARLQRLVGNGTSIAYPMFAQTGAKINIPIDQEWTEILPNLEMRWERTETENTHLELRCTGGVTLPIHSHPFVETVRVNSGKMIDSLSNRAFLPKDVWTIPSGEKHGATCYNCHLTITAEGKMELSNEGNICLDNMHSLIEYV